ncbi:MAG TPA: YIP1 family protein [Casimicrobiaceae bacterium]|nr:YIP1 family protein [Casimicrobiaceae bacterium]
MNCPKCGTTIADGATFCGNCGANLSTDPNASAQATPDASTPRSPGATPPSSEALSRLIERVKAILLTPTTEWPVIEHEATTAADIYKGYVAPLAAIGAIASFIGLSLIGIGGFFRVGIAAGLVHAIIAYLLTFVVVYAVAWLVDTLAPTFGGQRDSLRALKVTVYSYTPAWVAAVLNLVPALAVLGLIAALYGLYLLYLGLPVLMRNPPEKSLAYTVVVVLCAIVIGAVFAALSTCFLGAPAMMGAAHV